MSTLQMIHGAEEGDTALLRRYIDFENGDVNASQRNGWTPLHSAARSGHLKTCKFLVASGADTSAKTNRGQTALDVTLDAKVVEFLLTKTDKAPCTAFHRAAVSGQANALAVIMKHIRRAGGRIADDTLLSEDHEGFTGLLLATQEQHSPCVELILTGRSLLHRSLHYDFLNPRDAKGNTALHYAASGGDAASCAALLGAGADPTALCTRGLTPVDVSVTDEIKQLLRNASGVVVPEESFETNSVALSASRCTGSGQLLGTRPGVAWAHTDHTRSVTTSKLYRNPPQTESPLRTHDTLLETAKEVGTRTSYQRAFIEQERIRD